MARWKAALLGLPLAVATLMTAIAILAACCSAGIELPRTSVKGFEQGLQLQVVTQGP